MRKIILLISFFVFCNSFAQKKDIDAVIITNADDTLKVKIQLVVYMFDPTFIMGSSINSKVTLIGEDRKKTKMEASKIKELSFTDFVGKKRYFLNRSANKKTLQERLYDGNTIEWFRDYISGMGGDSASDFLFNKKTKTGIGVGYFTGLPKKKLKEFFGENEELNKLIDDTKSSPLREDPNNVDFCMEKIIQKYESLQVKDNK